MKCSHHDADLSMRGRASIKVKELSLEGGSFAFILLSLGCEVDVFTQWEEAHMRVRQGGVAAGGGWVVPSCEGVTKKEQRGLLFLLERQLLSIS